MKKCIECKSEIDDDATFCRHCSHYQSRLKNHFKFIATTIGILLAFIVILGFLGDITDYFSSKKEVEIISAQIDGMNDMKLNLINHNKNNAFITTLNVKVLMNKEKVLLFSAPLDIEIKGMDTKQYELDNPSIKEEDKSIVAILDGQNRDDDEYIYDYDKIYNSIKNKEDKSCLSIGLWSNNTTLSSVYNKIQKISIPLNATVKYSYVVAGYSEPREKTLPVTTTVLIKYIDSCLSKYANKRPNKT